MKRDSTVLVVGDYITEGQEYGYCVEDFLFDKGLYEEDGATMFWMAREEDNNVLIKEDGSSLGTFITAERYGNDILLLSENYDCDDISLIHLHDYGSAINGHLYLEVRQEGSIQYKFVSR